MATATIERELQNWGFTNTVRWTRGVDYGAGSAARPGKQPPPEWFPNVEDMKIIPNGLRSVGFSEEEVAKITHGNWLRLYEATFA